MIQEALNSMLTLLLAKFMLNDLPHAAGMYGNPNPGARYVPPEEKYRLVKRTKRGSLVVIQREGNLAKLEITNMEDMMGISHLLNAAGVKFTTEAGVGKHAWEETPAYIRTPREPPSIRAGTYPGHTLLFDYSDLERVMEERILQPLLLE